MSILKLLIAAATTTLILAVYIVLPLAFTLRGLGWDRAFALSGLLLAVAILAILAVLSRIFPRTRRHAKTTSLPQTSDLSGRLSPAPHDHSPLIPVTTLVRDQGGPALPQTSVVQQQSC